VRATPLPWPSGHLRDFDISAADSNRTKLVQVMPLCEGLPDKPCPRKAIGSLSQGDLMLCKHCEVIRFPYLKITKGKGKDISSTTSVRTRNSTRVSAKNESAANISLDTLSVCPRCQEPCHEPSENKSIVCDICSDQFHAQCTGLTTETFNTLVTIVKDTGWVCVNCRKTCNSKLVSIQTSLTRTDEELSMMQSLITALKCEIEELKVGVKAADSDSRQQNLIHSLPTISNEVPNESSFSKASAQVMEISKVVHDLNRRKCNVIVSGLAEPSGRNEPEKKDADVTQFTHLCEEHLDIKPAVSHLGCRRLGKLEDYSGKPRKLLICLASESAAASLLKSARLLRQSDIPYIASNVFINPDLSPAESKLAFERRQRKRAKCRTGIAQQRERTDNETDNGTPPQQENLPTTTDSTSAITSIVATNPASSSASGETLSANIPPPQTSSAVPAQVLMPFS